jgi:hypothetical protein
MKRALLRLPSYWMLAKTAKTNNKRLLSLKIVLGVLGARLGVLGENLVDACLNKAISLLDVENCDMVLPEHVFVSALSAPVSADSARTPSMRA